MPNDINDNFVARNLRLQYNLYSRLIELNENTINIYKLFSKAKQTEECQEQLLSMMASPLVRAKLHMYPLIFSKPSKVQGMTCSKRIQNHKSICKLTIF
jgi:hypothetical protein